MRPLSMKVVLLAVAALAMANAFVPTSLTNARSIGRYSAGEEDKSCSSMHTSLHLPSTALFQAGRAEATPPLRRNPARKICLMVEPTPFTHVSGYANRFKEMLKFLSKAGDDVSILTVDSKTPAKDLPKESFGYPISHTQGFTFPLYNHISLTFDLPEMKGAQILEQSRPDLIHVTSP